jgi:hypothetical protein
VKQRQQSNHQEHGAIHVAHHAKLRDHSEYEPKRQLWGNATVKIFFGTLKHEFLCLGTTPRGSKGRRTSSSISRCSIIGSAGTSLLAITARPSTKRGRWWLNPVSTELREGHSGHLPMRRKETLSLTVTLSNEQRIEVSQAAPRLVERLEAKQPGLMNFLEWQGLVNNARIISLLIQRAERYHARHS